MRVALIYRNELRFGDFRLSRWDEPQADGLQSLINFDDGNLGKPMVVIRNPVLTDIDYDKMTFVDPDTGDVLEVIPFDHTKDCYRLEHSVRLRVITPEPPRPPESPGDPDCQHVLQDDGDNLQVVCTKCPLRRDVHFDAQAMSDPAAG